MSEPINKSSASAESGFPAAIFAINECESSWLSFALRLEYAPSAAISFAPSAKRGPVKWRINAVPASGFVTTFIRDKTSATSAI